MKSPEQMGGTPEQLYDKAEWERLKRAGSVWAIKRGRELGVPREELNRFAEDIIVQAIENQEYGLVYRFRKNMGIGTEEEVRAAGEQAYKFFLENGDSGSAMSIAEEVYGRDSEEWRRANKESEKSWEKTKKKEVEREAQMESGKWNPFVTLSKDATFADLFSAIESHKEGGELDNYFTQELLNNFNSEIIEEILAFRDEQASKATATKVLDFFKERGYSQSDVSTFLPIKFEQE